MFLTVLFYIFITSVVIQVIYYLFILGRFAFLPQQESANKTLPSISVIICAKNEAENISTYLETVLNQQYPTFEVVVVNDASNDATLSILNTFKNKYQHLKTVNITATATYTGNKKNALTQGIAAATNEYLLFTDADCKPVSKNWITEMASQFTANKTLVLGYGAYKKIKGSFINKLIRFETLLTATHYFSYAAIGIPYMGVGRNLAYTKGLFAKANGFTTHIDVTSGDDDLLINQIATVKNTALCFSKNSFTISNPKTNLAAWFQQKRRHITTANYYKPIHQFLLGLFYVSQFLFWFLAIILLAFSFNGQLVTVLFIIRLITHYIIIGSSARKLSEKDLILFLPVLDFMVVLFQLSIYVRNLIAKPTSW